MGTDIHMHVEKKDGIVWRVVEPSFPCIWCHVKNNDGVCYTCKDSGVQHAFYDRNYALFSMLADVRNGYGVAGVDTGDGYRPISKPRGVPDDRAEYPDGDHTESWLMLRELVEYDLTQLTVRRGVVSLDRYLELDGAIPKKWSGRVFGPGLKTVTRKEYESGDTDGVTHVQVQWLETYLAAGGRFWTDFVPSLLKIGELDNVRIVFNFDS